MFLLKSMIGKVIAAVALLVILGGGWYFFIREDNEAQKSAADVSDAVRSAASAQAGSPAASSATTAPGATTAPTTAASTSAAASTLAAKNYRLVKGQSSAWYLAPEKLASLPTSSVAKGTTTNVTGEFHVTASGLDTAKPTTFTVDLSSLKSDQDRRDGRVQSALETNKFKSAVFTAKTLTGMTGTFTAAEVTMTLAGTMNLHGVQKDITWDLKVKQDGDILSILGTTKFKYSDFAITKPDIGGFVSVEDEVTLQVQLYAAPA